MQWKIYSVAFDVHTFFNLTMAKIPYPYMHELRRYTLLLQGVNTKMWGYKIRKNDSPLVLFLQHYVDNADLIPDMEELTTSLGVKLAIVCGVILTRVI